MSLTPQNDAEWIACQQTIAAMRRGEDPIHLQPPTEPVTTKVLVSDAALLAHLGFTKQSEQDLIAAFAIERDLSVRALLAVALRHYHTQTVVGPEYMLKHMLGQNPGPPLATEVLAPPPPGHPDHQPFGCPALD